ncbi:dTMP kinase [Desulfovibrio ferrophilus]|uniref:Thymidylate kinase n=1 Tax=Desulfovibrio ferrophilus TaxID=241368 RepID=A0A2Z6B0D3_9BACT|nr:dTMP kinase [Desulfovibrio ferrophilus]BBD08923.1 thymidylate kinase [Desulfovibrio ferrophilus]
MFITFEGIEGSGKSTVMGRVQEHLEAQGYEVLRTLEPGGSRLGRQLRKILLDMESRDLTGESELFLYLADRAQHVASVIRPALEAGQVVLSDRYADSTIVYQGYGRGLDPKLLHTFNDVAAGGLWPDLTLLFDLSPEVGLKRALTRNLREGLADSEGRFEAESLEFHNRIREGYLTWGSLYQKRFRTVNAEQGLAEVVRDAIEVIDQNLVKRADSSEGPKPKTLRD